MQRLLDAVKVTAPRDGRSSWLTAERKLIAVWLVLGLVPLVLQIRSYAQFVKPHTMPKALVVPPDQEKKTANLTQVCPAEAFVLAGVWWNIEPAHYYTTENGIICHTVTSQYNTHQNYFIGSSRVEPYRTTPPSCANDSFTFHAYLYHASFGFYSFYGGNVGTYCAKDKSAYLVVEVLGAYDVNGPLLANDTGSTEPRRSYWYSTVGALWLVYRCLVIRRSYLLVRNYGCRCDEMGEALHPQAVVVFVQESLRLSAHGATNYHRVGLLYLVVEGVMTDVFLIIVKDGWATKVQYASLGYNLSGLMLLLFEMVESMRWLSEKWRLRIKRSVFSYETALFGEFVVAIVFQYFLTALNKSDLKRSKPQALAVSYYFWSLVCHGILVVVVIGIILSVRVLCALVYVWHKYRSFAVLSEPCCVDTALGVRSRIMLLSGYQWEDSKLYYKPEALKAFGMLKMVEDGVEYLALHKLRWFTASRDNLIGIGVISGERVEPCNERPCSGVINFLDRMLGGASAHTGYYYRTQQTIRILVGPDKPNDSA